MSDTVITVDKLSKLYRIGTAAQRHDSLRELIMSAAAAPLRRLRRLGEASAADAEAFWALKDVSFEVKRGEVLGIIGRNGAGKSTLLKILSRIVEPTEGRVHMRGRVASLLEVGTGFHPELTGRENIYLNGAILGMKKAEIDRKFDEIVAFSEIEKFLDTPVKRYSSGMYVRLAFAVAAHLDPEILICDEVLAVGDVAFQKKCLGKMQEVSRGQGRTVLFVSHNMAAVQALCRDAVLLQNGRRAHFGDTSSTIARYLAGTSQTADQPLADRNDRQGNGRIRVVAFEARTACGPAGLLRTGAPAEFRFAFRAEGAARNVHMAMGFLNHLDQRIAWFSNEMTGDILTSVPAQGCFVCRLSKLPLLPGRYWVNFQCRAQDQVTDWVQAAASFEVVSGDFFGTGRLPPKEWGHVVLEHHWSVE